MKTTTLIECQTKTLYDVFMGQSNRPIATTKTWIGQLLKDMKKIKRKDPTSDYYIEYPDEKSLKITITGKDSTVKEIFRENKKYTKRLKNRMTLKIMRTKLSHELIK